MIRHICTCTSVDEKLVLSINQVVTIKMKTYILEVQTQKNVD